MKLPPPPPAATLHIETPDSTALVRFLSAFVEVEVTLRVDEEGFRHVEVEARALDGEGSSSSKYEVAGPTFPPYETEPAPKLTSYVLVRLPLEKYAITYPNLTHWRDAVHDGRRVDGIYMLVPGSEWCYWSSCSRYISLTLVGVEIEWPDDLDDKAREALHECEDEVLKESRHWDLEHIDVSSADLFVSPGVWRPEALHADLGEFTSLEEALEHWSSNPPMVPTPTTPPADAGKE